MKKMRLKTFKLIGIIGLLLLILNSCSDTGIDEKIHKVPYVKEYELNKLNFIGHWKGEGKKEGILKDFVREYSFLNQEVLINYKFPDEAGFDYQNASSIYNFIKRNLSQSASDWDILLINDAMESMAETMGDSNWAKNNLVDFSKFPEFVQNISAEINLDEVKKRWNGIVPGPFLEGNYWALWSNKNVSDKLGIEIKQIGMTIDDFLHYIKVVDEYNQTHNEHITPFKESNDWETNFTLGLNLFMSEIGSVAELKDSLLSEKKLNAWHKTLKAFEEVAKYNPIDSDVNRSDWNSIKYCLQEEKCLFFASGSWMYNIWQEHDETTVMNCVPNEFPVFENVLPMYPSGFPILWVVPKNAPNKEEAIKLLLKMNNPTLAEDWVRYTKCPTGIKGSIANGGFGTDQYEQFLGHIKNTYGSNIYSMIYDSQYIFGKKHANKQNYFRDVFFGDLSADEAMEKIYKSLESV